ncbi:hypothetical protein GF376_00960 [Candidatus Peregrinibacteria bacterium]|nr:hypothetical protein [Candidatus Peregrinibacteria bacterium]
MPKINLSDKRYIPFYISAIIAIIALILYIYSEQTQISLNNRSLTVQSEVKNVELEETNQGRIMSVECEDGTVYEAFFEDGEVDYQNILKNKCKTQ